MTDPSLRASDAERDAVVESLRQDLVDGRLTLEEFTERVGAALAARTRGDLAVIRTDLPDVVRPTPAVPGARSARLVPALFGHVVRRGSVRLRRRSSVLATFADIDLDLRAASLEAASSSITAVVLFGNVDVYVPEGVNVEIAGLAVFGHHRLWGRDADSAGAPTVRLRVMGLFATVDVWSVPRDLHGDYSEIIRVLEGKPPRALPQ